MKEETKNLNKNTSIKKGVSLKSILNLLKKSMQKYGIALALNYASRRIFVLAIFLLLYSVFVFADGWTSSEPSHQTLYADTITSRGATGDGNALR